MPKIRYKHTKETKEKMSKNHADISGKNNPFYGIQHTEEAKKKMSQSHKETWARKNFLNLIT